MSPDIEAMLQPVTPEAPCGEDLEYDAARLQLERLANGTPGHEMGKVTVPAEEPDWSAVEDEAAKLLQRSKDVTVASHLVRALLVRRGFQGLSEGLELVNELLREYWDCAYPRIDPEDPSSAARVNALAFLVGTDTLLNPIRRTAFVASRSHGQFSLRDVHRASGRLAPAPDKPAPDPKAIEAALMECELTELESNAAAVKASLDRVAALESMLSEKLGQFNVIDVDPLRKLLKEISLQLEGPLERRRPQLGAHTEGGVSMPAGAEKTGPVGPIKSRDDVIRILDSVSDFMRHNEPSSPVPLLLQRAKRLVSKNFMEILEDLAPEAVNQVEKISGPKKP